MSFFPCAHAGHPVWQHATNQVVAQLQAQISMQKLQARTSLGVVYLSASYAEQAQAIVGLLSQALPRVQHWVGCATPAVLAGDTDYGATGALAVMLPCVPAAQYQVFSGITPWHTASLEPFTALVHGDARTPNLARHVQALQQHMDAAALVGGVCDLGTYPAQWAWGANTLARTPASMGGGGVQQGGLSGVAFAQSVDCTALSIQGCQPVGGAYTVTQVDGDVVLALDGRPALEVVRSDEHWSSMLGPHGQLAPPVDTLFQPMAVMAQPPAGAALAGRRRAQVMPVVGVDFLRQGLVLRGLPQLGSVLTLCQSDAPAMRADLRRVCAELWESLTTPDTESSSHTAGNGRSIAGAIFIRSQHRHALRATAHVDEELQWIRHALGPIPLLGFSSTCEVEAGALQHESAQLLVFTQPLQALL